VDELAKESARLDEVGIRKVWEADLGKQNVTFIAKWLHEFHAENRLEGDHIYLSFALDW
jgi:hypothetical protein